jgi:hypothetical protein
MSRKGDNAETKRRSRARARKGEPTVRQKAVGWYKTLPAVKQQELAEKYLKEYYPLLEIYTKKYLGEKRGNFYYLSSAAFLQRAAEIIAALQSRCWETFLVVFHKLSQGELMNQEEADKYFWQCYYAARSEEIKNLITELEGVRIGETEAQTTEENQEEENQIKIYSNVSGIALLPYEFEAVESEAEFKRRCWAQLLNEIQDTDIRQYLGWVQQGCIEEPVGERAKALSKGREKLARRYNVALHTLPKVK